MPVGEANSRSSAVALKVCRSRGTGLRTEADVGLLTVDQVRAPMGKCSPPGSSMTA